MVIALHFHLSCFINHTNPHLRPNTEQIGAAPSIFECSGPTNSSHEPKFSLESDQVNNKAISYIPQFLSKPISIVDCLTELFYQKS